MQQAVYASPEGGAFLS